MPLLPIHSTLRTQLDIEGIGIINDSGVHTLKCCVIKQVAEGENFQVQKISM